MDRAEAQRILDQIGMTNQQKEVALAIQYGALTWPDPNRGPGWFKYKLNNWYLWETPKDGRVVWAMARLNIDVVPNYYYGHQYRDNLLAAFESALNDPIPPVTG